MADTVQTHAMITYDVSARQGEVKAKMVAEGYLDSFTLNSVKTPVYIMPDTALWKPKTSTVDALADLEAVVAELNTPSNPVRLERAVATLFQNVKAIPGEKRK